MLRQSNLILLWNVAAMFFISFCTDYWHYEFYNFDKMKSDLSTNANSSLTLVHYSEWQMMIVLKAGSKEVNIYNRHRNLFRECVELWDTTIERLQADGYPITGSCSYYIFFRPDVTGETGLAYKLKWLSFLTGLTGSTFIIIGVCLGTVGALRHNYSLLKGSAICLISMEISLVITMAAFIVKKRELEAIARTKSTEIGRFVASYYSSSFGWSFVAATTCAVLTAAAIYVFLATAKTVRQKIMSGRRRQDFRQIMMKSCQSEIALAVRAKMIFQSTESL